MNGGFTTYRNGRGFAAKCGCGWRGPWRGLSLSVVELDAEKHAAKCPNACTKSARNGLRPASLEPLTYMGGPGDAATRPGTWPALEVPT